MNKRTNLRTLPASLFKAHYSPTERIAAIGPMLVFRRKSQVMRQRPLQIDGHMVRNLQQLAVRIAKAHRVSSQSVWNWYCAFLKSGYPGASPVRADRGSSRYFERFPEAAAVVAQMHLIERASAHAIHRVLRQSSANTPAYGTVLSYVRSLSKVLRRMSGNKGAS